MLKTMLRSAKEFCGYGVYTADAYIGKIREFYLNDREWSLSCIAVSTADGPNGKGIYLSSRSFEEADPDLKRFFIQQRIEVPAPDPSLKPVRRLFGFLARARDGRVGQVEDVVLNDADLSVRYLVLNAEMLGKKFIVSPWKVEKIDWRSGKIQLHTGLAEIYQNPEYNFHMPVSREYENELYEHYGKQSYWT